MKIFITTFISLSFSSYFYLNQNQFSLKYTSKYHKILLVFSLISFKLKNKNPQIFNRS
jgi:hypothetical protein